MDRQPTVGDRMSPAPISVPPSETIESALRLMSDRNLRHLPIVDSGRVVGMLSEREAQLALALFAAGAARVSVEIAMSKDPFRVTKDDALATVVREMAAKKLGSAVVMQGDELVGVFTTIDALNALADLLERP